MGRIVSTFDNKTYAYTINDYEHVLLMDGSKTLPIAVLTRTVSGEQKEVRILSGETKVEIIPGGPSSLKVKLNGQERPINLGETFIEKNSQTGEAIVEIKHFQDGVYHVYVATQLLHVLTDGKSVEVVAPQLLKNRAVGLCGDLNGEEVADLPSPQKCIMKPKLAAESYMLPKRGNSYPCAGVPHADREELKAEIQECAKEIVVPTPIIPIFERALAAPMPLLSVHKVEKQMNKVCISKEKIKTCGGASGAQGGMTQKTVKFACVAGPSTKAQTLEKRAIAGESLGAELTGFSTAYTKMEAEPMYCGSYGATGGMGGMATGGMGGNGEFGSYGNSGIGGGYGSSSGDLPTLKPISFNFNGASQTLNLPPGYDGHSGGTMRMDKQCNNSGVSPLRIRIVMQGAGGSKARGISKCINASPYSCRNALVVRGTEKSVGNFAVSDIHNYEWAFAMASSSGLVFPVYEIENKNDMRAGCSYTFTWTQVE